MGSNDTSTSILDPSGFSASSCGTFQYYRFFRFRPSTSGLYSFSTCGGAGWDIIIAVMSSCGDLSSLLGCSDNACGSQSSTTAILYAGTDYYVALGGRDSNSFGPANLDVVSSRVLSARLLPNL